MLVTIMLMVAIDLHSMGKITMELLWKSMATINCFGWRKKLYEEMLYWPIGIQYRY